MSLVSIGAIAIAACNGSSSSSNVGGGPKLVDPRGIAVEFDGNIVVADRSIPAVVRIDISNGNRVILSGGVDRITGDRALVSDADTGSGPLLVRPVGDALEADGNLVVTDPGRGAVVQVNPTNGNRLVISE